VLIHLAASLPGSIINSSALGECLNTNSIFLFIIILLPAILVVILIVRLYRNQSRLLQEKQGRDAEFKGSIHNAIETTAIVISKSEKFVPNAGNFAKVDLLVEIKLPDKAPVQISTCWLVKMDSLDQVLPGKNVPIQVDPKKTSRILPDVTWAKPWIFD
jgi:hypothetical protein